jgi:hypothetical protein
MQIWEVTAMTNFILASGVFLAGGLLLGQTRQLRSAFGFWAVAMIFLGIGALLGGIDHGFFETHGDTPVRMIIQKMTWISLGILTFFTLLTTGYQFASARARTAFLVVGLAQLALFTILAILINDFLVVIVNYAPIMILFLVLNIVNLRRGTGSWQMTAGLLLSFAASALQSLSVDVFTPLDRNGLYHIVMLISVAFLCLGGRMLKQE